MRKVIFGPKIFLKMRSVNQQTNYVINKQIGFTGFGIHFNPADL